ncbi:T6SS immunity protein Tdi1 domain-containing protein [Mucilaginibacter sp. CAU 1740]|uniref:T6SS immunity protein Tdi1 domain-containing protein n=1 Tax=Mucilaginibacter sp. CAU 1740 TaxID=3140365 RepID=UPI00325B11F4
MDFYLDDLTIKTTGIKVDSLLETWKWLVDDFAEVLVISKLGDVFFTSRQGQVYWLATDTFTLTQIAADKADFNSLLNDAENVDNWFLPQLLQQLEQAGIFLNDNQVYNFKKMPVMGGEYSADNIEPIDIEVHFHLTGQIGKQIKDLPNGTKIKLKIVD